MVHFFGIFSPVSGPGMAAPEAPFKTDFFGGSADIGHDYPSLAERDALCLSGKLPLDCLENRLADKRGEPVDRQ